MPKQFIAVACAFTPPSTQRRNKRPRTVSPTAVANWPTSAPTTPPSLPSPPAQAKFWLLWAVPISTTRRLAAKSTWSTPPASPAPASSPSSTWPHSSKAGHPPRSFGTSKPPLAMGPTPPTCPRISTIASTAPSSCAKHWAIPTTSPLSKPSSMSAYAPSSPISIGWFPRRSTPQAVPNRACPPTMAWPFHSAAGKLARSIWPQALP